LTRSDRSGNNWTFFWEVIGMGTIELLMGIDLSEKVEVFDEQ
jgi:hypothetical protein